MTVLSGGVAHPSNGTEIQQRAQRGAHAARCWLCASIRTQFHVSSRAGADQKTRARKAEILACPRVAVPVDDALLRRSRRAAQQRQLFLHRRGDLGAQHMRRRSRCRHRGGSPTTFEFVGGMRVAVCKSAAFARIVARCCGSCAGKSRKLSARAACRGVLHPGGATQLSAVCPPPLPLIRRGEMYCWQAHRFTFRS